VTRRSRPDRPCRVVEISNEATYGTFSGAGASSETGLPLVWEPTNEFKEWLTPEKLRELIEDGGFREVGTPTR